MIRRAKCKEIRALGRDKSLPGRQNAKDGCGIGPRGLCVPTACGPLGRPAGLRLEFEGDFRQSACYTWGMDGRLDGMILSNAQDRAVEDFPSFPGYDDNGNVIGYWDDLTT